MVQAEQGQGMSIHCLSVVLPWPPSVNAMWRTVTLGKRKATLLSREGRQYRTDALMVLAEATKQHITPLDRLRVEMVLHEPDARRRDVDNFSKAPLDACTHAKIWTDDSQIDDLRVKRGPKQQGGAVQLNVWRLA